MNDLLCIDIQKSEEERILFLGKVTYLNNDVMQNTPFYMASVRLLTGGCLLLCAIRLSAIKADS